MVPGLDVLFLERSACIVRCCGVMVLSQPHLYQSVVVSDVAALYRVTAGHSVA